jgi:phycoerythrin-associated linker protein
LFLVVKSWQSQKAKGAQCAPFALFANCYKVLKLILKLIKVYLPLFFLFLMDIYQFLELFVGRWRSQRSDHQFVNGDGNDIRAVIEITALSVEAPEVIAICQKYDVVASPEITPMTFSWEEESLSSNKPKGSTSLIFVPSDLTSPQTGFILSEKNKGAYEFATDESLTIKTVTNQGLLEERIWYGNPNLRFRVATLLESNQTSDPIVLSSKFYSEIRSATPKP